MLCWASRRRAGLWPPTCQRSTTWLEASRAPSTHFTPRRRFSPGLRPRPCRWRSRPPRSRHPQLRASVVMTLPCDRRIAGRGCRTGLCGVGGKVGGNVRGARDEQSNLQTTVTAIGNQRQSVSGVSLDEEMTNLISFQRGYQASARTMTAMDSMLETLIEHTGIAGLRMSGRITPAMLTSSMLNGLNASLAAFQHTSTNCPLAKRSSNPRTTRTARARS